METAKELKQSDNYQTAWESRKDEARDECMTEADNIVMEVEHIVHDLDQTLDVQNTLILAEAINKIIELRYISFDILHVGGSFFYFLSFFNFLLYFFFFFFISTAYPME